MQRIERLQKTRISFSWARYVRRFSYAAFFGYLALLPIATIPFTVVSPAYTQIVILVGVASLGLLSGGYVLLRAKNTSMHIPYVPLAYALCMVSLGISTWLHGQGAKGYVGVSIDTGTLLGVGVSCAFLGLMLWMQPHLRTLYRLAVSGGAVTVILAALVLVYGFSLAGIRMPSALESVVPIAGMVLIAGVILLHGVRTLGQYAYLVAVLMSALVILTATGAIYAVWAAIAVVTGVYTCKYVRTLLFQATRATARHTEHLLGHMRAHYISIATAGVFFVAVAMVCIPTLSTTMTAPAFRQHAEIRTATWSETKTMLRGMFTEAPLLGNGLGDFDEMWQRHGFAQSLLSVPPTQAQSTAMTWLLAGGLLAGVWWFIATLLFFSSGIRVRYLPHFYDRGWYLVAHVSWVSAAFAIYYTCVSSIGTVALTIMMVSVGIFFNAHRQLIGEVEGSIQMPEARFVRQGVGLLCVMLACGVLYYVTHYVRATAIDSDAAVADARMPLPDFFRNDIDRRIETVQQLIGSEAQADMVLTQMRDGTARLLEALAEYPTNISLNERAVVWFSLLGSLGVEGSYARAETYVRTLTEYVPYSSVYAIAHAELLVYLNRKDEAREILTYEWLYTSDEARRVRINMLLAEEKFDDIQKELDESTSLRTSAYGQLIYAALMIHNRTYGDAGTYLDRFIERFPDVAEGYVFRAQLYRLAGENDPAHALLERGVVSAHSGDLAALRAMLAAFTPASTIKGTASSTRAGEYR